eukprot:c33269_g1_i1 orf=35-229(+)
MQLAPSPRTTATLATHLSWVTTMKSSKAQQPLCNVKGPVSNLPPAVMGHHSKKFKGRAAIVQCE